VSCRSRRSMPGIFDPRFLGAILAQQSLGSGSKPPIRIGNQFINARATNLVDHAARWGWSKIFQQCHLPTSYRPLRLVFRCMDSMTGRVGFWPTAGR
jgi:hypothetical protein